MKLKPTTKEPGEKNYTGPLAAKSTRILGSEAGSKLIYLPSIHLKLLKEIATKDNSSQFGRIEVLAKKLRDDFTIINIIYRMCKEKEYEKESIDLLTALAGENLELEIGMAGGNKITEGCKNILKALVDKYLSKNEVSVQLCLLKDK